MPRKIINALTPLAVKNAKPGRHADGLGLYLLVKESGARSWLYRATIAGKVRDIGLGSAGQGGVSLAEAREMARDKAREVRAGGVPVSDRRKRGQEAKAAAKAAKVASATFRTVADAYIDLKWKEWKNAKHRAQWSASLEAYAYPHLGAMAVCEIGTEQVLAVLQPIWNDKPETASRLRGRIENVLDSAKVQGLRTGENPARWRGHLDHILPKPTKVKAERNRKLERNGHHPALDYAKLPAFIADLAARDALAARALEFTILNNVRTGEAVGATWQEIDLDAGVWTIPAARMKADKEHIVPLSARSLAILRAVQPLNTKGSGKAPVFPGTKGKALSNMAMAMLVRRMHDAETEAGRTGWIAPKSGGKVITVHGFRSTFREWAGEQSSFPREVIEHAMAHQLPDKAEAAYHRKTMLPKRRKLMDAWAGYAASHGAAGDKVVPIRKA